MIKTLPIQLKPFDNEPGYSFLARLSHANACRSTHHFALGTGLDKRAIQVGDCRALKALAELGQADEQLLKWNSPRISSNSTTTLKGQEIASRSIRKKDMVVCPVCWAEQRASTHLADLHLCIDAAWLPFQTWTCCKHRVALRPLPYQDYTTCYDHVSRMHLRHAWLQRALDAPVSQNPTSFELAVDTRLQGIEDPETWLDNVRLDLVEKWCVGLAAFLDGTRSVGLFSDKLAMRELAGVGYSIAKKGKAQVRAEIDSALARHRCRLGRGWFMSWSKHNSGGEPRKILREFAKQLSEEEGHHCLLSFQSHRSPEMKLKKLANDVAKRTNSSAKWVCRSLKAEGYIGDGGQPTDSFLSATPDAIEQRIVQILSTLSSSEAARRLGVTNKVLGRLCKLGLVSKYPNSVFKKPRFETAKLDALLVKVSSSMHHANSSKSYVSIKDACSEMHVELSLIVRMLLSHPPPKAEMQTPSCLASIRIDLDGLKTALIEGTDFLLTQEHAKFTLGVDHRVLQGLEEQGYLVTVTGRTPKTYRREQMVMRSSFDAFDSLFKTKHSLAQHLGFSKRGVSRRIHNRNAKPDFVIADTPFYRTTCVT